jgi:PPOX class probable F420-dependent enzyme
VPQGGCAGIEELPPAAAHLFREARRAVLTTIDGHGRPHAIPVCFGLRGSDVVTAVDQKPKRGGELARVANVRRRPVATVLVDRWDEDWSRLAWVMLRGRAEILSGGAEHAEALRLLRARYAQLAAMDLAGRPVIAIRIERTTSWGELG